MKFFQVPEQRGGRDMILAGFQSPRGIEDNIPAARRTLRGEGITEYPRSQRSVTGRTLASVPMPQRLLSVFPREGHGADLLPLLLDRHASVLGGVGGPPLARWCGGRQNTRADPCQNVLAHGTIRPKTG